MRVTYADTARRHRYGGSRFVHEVVGCKPRRTIAENYRARRDHRTRGI
jgi:hypothetical protein